MVGTRFFCSLDIGLSVKGLKNIRAGTKSPRLGSWATNQFPHPYCAPFFHAMVREPRTMA
jgi:hypothetical protein